MDKETLEIKGKIEKSKQSYKEYQDARSNLRKIFDGPQKELQESLQKIKDKLK